MIPLTLTRPLAITMWDFSWLERRWPGAGYADWDVALSGLMERGYDVVRIDAYPHLVSADAERTWELLPEWNTQDWGAPARVEVQVWPALPDFISACARHGLKVALSTWFRQDAHNHRMNIADGRAHADIWINTLRRLEQAGLMQHILFVDLCNEWALNAWSPFFNAAHKDAWYHAPASHAWMHRALARMKEVFPALPCTFSTFPYKPVDWTPACVEPLDLLELHVWMTGECDFYARVGYNYERFDMKGYENLVRHGEKLYRSNPDHWRAVARQAVLTTAEIGRAMKRPLVTTECWGIVDYKDWPGLKWDWVKELCEIGVETACSTGQWAMIATSNFCGPQFRGMWDDIAWHRRLTDQIHRAALPRF